MSTISRCAELLRAKPSMLLMMIAARWPPLRIRSRDWIRAASSEFGRSPKINDCAGRDHWPGAYTALLAGGGVRGGRVIGASDKEGAFPTERPIHPANLHATILEVFGVDRQALFALSLNPDAEPVRELF